MTNFEIAFKITLGFEGDYTDDKNDSGGKTKYGIIEEEARGFGYTGDMKDFSLAQAKDIYYRKYWLGIMLDKVEDQDVANKLFDSYVNCGNVIKKWAQRICNVLNQKYPLEAVGAMTKGNWNDITVDGAIGMQTIAAINLAVTFQKQNFLKAFNSLQGEYYITISEMSPKNKRFTNGWFANRISALK